MKANIFTNELAKTSSVFGRKKDIEVVFEGDGAKTDGSKVFLPSINLNADVTDEQAAIMRGYVDHEAGHVRHTDFKALHKNRHKMVGNKLLHQCANALEDVWLEQRVREEYSGSETNLRAVSQAVNGEFLKHIEHNDERLRDPVWVGPVAATWEGRKTYGGDTNEQCLAMLDDEMHEMIGEIVKRVDDCKTSHDVFELAEEFEAKLRATKAEREAEEPEGEPERGEGEGEGEGETEKGEKSDEDGDTEGDMDDTTRGKDAPDKDGTGKPERSDVDDGDTPDSTVHADDPSATDDDGLDDDVFDDFGVNKALEKMMEDREISGAGADGYRPLTTQFDTWLHRSDSPNKWGKGTYLNRGHYVMGKSQAYVYDNMLSEMSGVVNMCRRKLERALIAKQNRDWDNAKEDGRLDTRRLTAAVAGKTNVFKTRTDRDEMDTALTLLVDLSGSMYRGTPSRVEVAGQCVIAFCEAIDRTGIKYEVLGFDNTFHQHNTLKLRQMMEKVDVWEYGRCEALNMAVFKHFNERLHDCKGSIASIRDMAQGNNSDGEALLLANARLQDRPEKRKVLMVLSDGNPACTYERYLSEHLLSVVRDIEETDTDIIGIGIQSTAVSDFYSKHVVVRSLDDLQGVVMSELAKLLLGERMVLDHSKLMDRAV